MEQFEKLQQTYEMLHIAQIVFGIIGAIGLVMIIYGFYKHSDREKKRGIFILFFGIIVVFCLNFIEKRTKDQVQQYMYDSYMNAR